MKTLTDVLAMPTPRRAGLEIQLTADAFKEGDEGGLVGRDLAVVRTADRVVRPDGTLMKCPWAMWLGESWSPVPADVDLTQMTWPACEITSDLPTDVRVAKLVNYIRTDEHCQVTK